MRWTRRLSSRFTEIPFPLSIQSRYTLAWRLRRRSVRGASLDHFSSSPSATGFTLRRRRLRFHSPSPLRRTISLGHTSQISQTRRLNRLARMRPRRSIQSFRDLWIPLPDTLRVGVTWSDSTSFFICRSGIPLRATVWREFLVTAAGDSGGRVVLKLSRNARTSIVGHGEQAGAPVNVFGSGFGQLLYALDAISGQIIAFHGSATTDLSLQARGRAEHVHQVSALR